MHHRPWSSLVTAALVGMVTEPAWAAPVRNAWLADASHQRLLWMVLYVLLGLLVLLVAWEALFQMQRRRERLKVELAHGSGPSLGGDAAVAGSPAAGRGQPGSMAPAASAASEEDPFKSLLRRSAASAASGEGGEERPRGVGRAGGGATRPTLGDTPTVAEAAPVPVPPPVPPPAPPPVPPAATIASDDGVVEGASGGRKMVRLSLGGGEGEEPSAEPAYGVAPITPPRVAMTPAPERAGAGKDAWSDLLKKAPGAPPAPAAGPAPGGDASSDGAADPWKSLLRKTRDEGASAPPLGGPGRLAGSAPGARGVPPRATGEPTVKARDSAPAVASEARGGGLPTVMASRGESQARVALPGGTTRESWDRGIAQLQAGLAGPCRLAGAASAQGATGGETEALLGSQAAEPKRGRRMTLAGAGGEVAGADPVVAPPLRAAEAGTRSVTPGGPGRSVPLLAPARLLPADSKAEPLRISERPRVGDNLRVVRSTRDSHGEEEKEITGTLRNAEESRPGEMPEGI